LDLLPEDVVGERLLAAVGVLLDEHLARGVVLHLVQVAVAVAVARRDEPALQLEPT
jgi:type IV secretory pathway TrbD component